MDRERSPHPHISLSLKHTGRLFWHVSARPASRAESRTGGTRRLHQPTRAPLPFPIELKEHVRKTQKGTLREDTDWRGLGLPIILERPTPDPPQLGLPVNDPSSTRREFLASTGVVAAAWLGTDPEALFRALEAQRAAARGEQVAYEVLSTEQAADLDAIAAQILPSDDQLPGAREAHVIVFIDRALGDHMAGQAEALLEDLDELNRQVSERWGAGRFSELSDERQIELLQEIEDGAFFQQVRAAVLIGVFAHPDHGGNYDGVGWRLLGFEPRYFWRPPFGEYDAEEMGR